MPPRCETKWSRCPMPGVSSRLVTSVQAPYERPLVSPLASEWHTPCGYGVVICPTTHCACRKRRLSNLGPFPQGDGVPIICLSYWSFFPLKDDAKVGDKFVWSNYTRGKKIGLKGVPATTKQEFFKSLSPSTASMHQPWKPSSM